MFTLETKFGNNTHFYYFSIMIPRLLLILALLVPFGTALNAASHPKYEVRAAWVSTEGGRDWPRGLYEETRQKEALIQLLDKLNDANFNTLFFQMQGRGGVAWDSSHYPAMVSLTGDGSIGTAYDIPQFVIDECRKRHIECHAWLTPFAHGSRQDASRYQLNRYPHVSASRPEICVSFNGNYYIDPGIPEGREMIVESYREMLSRYDFDGINLDLSSYDGRQFPDDDSYEAYNPDNLTREEWRRDNMTAFVAEVAEMVSEIAPDIKIGVSTLGVYKPTLGYDNKSAYNSAYQDPVLWVDSRYADYLSPRMSHEESLGFSKNLAKWAEMVPGAIIPGIMTGRLAESAVSVNDLTRQIDVIRDDEGCIGIAIDGLSTLFGNGDKANDMRQSLASDYFRYPAHIHPKDDLYDFAPNPPVNVEARYTGDGYAITWEEPFPSAEGTLVKYYSIYLSDGHGADTSNPEYIVCAKTDGMEFFYPAETAEGLQFAITAFDTDYRESLPAITKSALDDIYLPVYFYYHQGAIYLSDVKPVERLEIYSLTGNRVMHQEIGASQATVDCGRLAPGVYVAKAVYSDGTSSMHKFAR